MSEVWDASPNADWQLGIGMLYVCGSTGAAVIRNSGSGEGEIQVDFRARPRDGGAPLSKSEKASLRPNETARVEVRLEGARGDEQLEVEVDYPPR